MPITLHHVFTSPKADGTNTNLVRPSNWNSSHVGTLSVSASEVSGAFDNAGGITFGYDGTHITAAAPAGAPSPVNISAGTTSNNLGSVVFSNSGGISFGLNGSTVTATVATNYMGSNRASDFVAATATIAGTNITGTIGSNGLSLSAAAGGGGGAAISGGANSQSTGTVNFSNSNGVTFGLSNNGVMTATVATNYQSQGAYLTTAMASNRGSDFMGTNTALTANGVSVTANSSGLSLNFPAFLTTAMQSQSSSVFAKTGFTSTTTAGTAVVGTLNTNGLSVGVPAYITTAMQSNAATISNINISASTTSTNASAFTFSNANGVSFGLGTGASAGVITASVAAAGGAQTGISGLANSETTYTSGSVTFRDLNGISWQSTTGQQFQITHALQFTSNTSNITSNALNTSASRVINVVAATNNAGGGTASLSSNVSFSNANGLTFYTSAGNAIVGSYTVPTQTVQPVAVSGSNGSFVFSTVTFGSSNGMHFYTTNGSVVGSYTVPTVTNSSWTVSDSATSGSVARLAFTNLNGMTLSLSTGAAGSHTVVGSYTVPVSSNGILDVSTATAAGTATSRFAMHDHQHRGIRGIVVNGTASTFFGDYVISAGNNITLSTAGNSTAGSIAIHGAAGGGGGVAAVQAATDSTGGGLSALVGSVSFMSANGFTFYTSSNATTHGIVLTSKGSISAYAVSNTTNSSSGVVNATAMSFAGAGGASVGVSNGSVIVSAPDRQLTMYATGNTTQNSSTTGLNASSLLFQGLGIASVGYSNGSIQISVPAGGGAGDGGNVLAAGTRTAGTNSTVLFSNANGVTFGLDAVNGSVMTASVAAGAGVPALSKWEPNGPNGISNLSIGQNSLFFLPLWPGNDITFNNINMLFSLSSVTSAISHSVGETISYGLYAPQTGASSTVIEPLSTSSMYIQASYSSNLSGGYTIAMNGSSTTVSSAGTAFGSVLSGYKQIALPFAGSMAAGSEYYFCMACSTTSTGNTGALRLSVLFNAGLSNASHGRIATNGISISDKSYKMELAGFIGSVTSNAWTTLGDTARSQQSNLRPWIVFEA